MYNIQFVWGTVPGWVVALVLCLLFIYLLIHDWRCRRKMKNKDQT